MSAARARCAPAQAQKPCLDLAATALVKRRRRQQPAPCPGPTWLARPAERAGLARRRQAPPSQRTLRALLAAARPQRQRPRAAAAARRQGPRAGACAGWTPGSAARAAAPAWPAQAHGAAGMQTGPARSARGAGCPRPAPPRPPGDTWAQAARPPAVPRWRARAWACAASAPAARPARERACAPRRLRRLPPPRMLCCRSGHRAAFGGRVAGAPVQVVPCAALGMRGSARPARAWPCVRCAACRRRCCSRAAAAPRRAAACPPLRRAPGLRALPPPAWAAAACLQARRARRARRAGARAACPACCAARWAYTAAPAARSARLQRAAGRCSGACLGEAGNTEERRRLGGRRPRLPQAERRQGGRPARARRQARVHILWRGQARGGAALRCGAAPRLRARAVTVGAGCLSELGQAHALSEQESASQQEPFTRGCSSHQRPGSSGGPCWAFDATCALRCLAVSALQSCAGA